ncbi:MAG: KamA family protein [Tannerellaceae bacterium]|nr:KamA family protein [Tannerellaceae bacterium]
MVKKNLFDLELSRLLKQYKNRFPALYDLAIGSKNVEEFKTQLTSYIRSCPVPEIGERENEVKERILRLVEFDGKEIDELSTATKLQIQTITSLWRFLRGDLSAHVSPDLLLDLYRQFEILEQGEMRMCDKNWLKRQMNRWPGGLDPEVVAIRKKNKQRIIELLIRKIDKRVSPASRYQFAPGMTWDEKYQQVEEWWNSSRFHLVMAVKSPTELNLFLGNTLSDETMKLLFRARKKQMPFFVTPYYLSLLNTGSGGYDDRTIRTYILYSEELVDTYGDIKAWEREDEVEPGKPNAAGWLLPEGNNIHRRYPEVAILIPDSMGRACGGLCASCQRMYDFQSQRLNFDLESLKPKDSWDHRLRRLMHYFEEDSQLRDILITGGDAFMSQNATLRRILDAVFRMAMRKKKANEKRPEGEKYAELQRVRLGSRLLAYLPQRVTPELVEILREFRQNASVIGVKQFYIQTHFQSPLEVTPEALQAIQAIQDAGWTITNQLVFTVAASRRGHTARLRQVLNSVGVVCYYTFSVKGYRENYAMYAPNSRSIQESYEEKSFGYMPKEKREELYQLIRTRHPLGKYLPRFLKENKLLFAGTDRNVLNLPAIGKSMTFVTVGIMNDGKRILKFDHDSSRRHSPVIDSLGEVYIVENKSVAAYLRQLREMGEDLKDYKSIWSFCEGTTEARFSIYEYPPFDFRVTENMTNYLSIGK